MNLPLKVKQVGILDVAALADLPAHYPDAAAFLRSVAAYLWDSSRYEHVPPPSALKQTGFTAAEEQLMLNSKFSTFNGRPTGSVFGFKTAQFSKGCSRPVWNCYINGSFKDSLPHYHLQPQSVISAKLHALNTKSSIFVQFDFASYYDQFELAPGVSPSFCFKGRNGETFALSRLPMGFNMACAIAQSATWQLLNFPSRSQVFTCIDNVAFCGEPETVAHDVKLFLQRCSAVSATLNEWSPTAIARLTALEGDALTVEVSKLHQPSFSFLGVQYNWPVGTKTLPDAARDKLRALRWCVENLNGTIRPRQIAAVLGFLRYAASIFNLRPLQFYTMLAWSRRVGAVLQADVALWDSVDIRFPIEHKQQILAWIAAIETAQPVPIARPRPLQQPLTIIFDASATGWGAVAVDADGVRSFSGRWPAPIHSSVEAEPRAAFEAAKAAIDPRNPPAEVFLMSDHEALVKAARSLAPRAFSYNLALSNLANWFPSTRFTFGYLKGTRNVADGLSRGCNSEMAIDPITASEIAGAGWLDALKSHNPQIVCPLCDASSLPWQC